MAQFPSPRAALPIGGSGLQHDPSQQDHEHLQDHAHEMVDWKYQHYLDNLISLFICLSSQLSTCTLFSCKKSLTVHLVLEWK